MAGIGVAITSGDAIPLLDDNGSAQYIKGRNSALDIRKGLLGSIFQLSSDGLTPRSGVLMGVGATGAFKVNAQGSPNQTVLIGKGHAIVPRTGQGAYLVYMDVDQTVNMPAASGANTRYDIVCLASFDLGNFVGDGAHGPQFWIESGTLGGGVPATPTGMIKLAEVFRAVNDNTISTEIVDKRMSTVVSGAPRILGPGDSTADAGILVGELRDVNGRLDRWSGSAWQQISAVVAPRGWVAGEAPTVTKTSAGTTETVACVAQWTAEAGRRYSAEWQGDMSSSGTTTGSGFRLRWKATASLTDVTGAIMSARDSTTDPGSNRQCDAFGEFVAAASGTHTVVATIRATNGNGNAVQAYGVNDHTARLSIRDIGV